MTASRIRVAALGALLCCAIATPWAQPVRLVSAGNEIAFTTRQMGVPVEGRFGKFSVGITLDPKKPEAGSVSLAIATGSARFGAAETDAEVVKPEWLAAGAFPQATFKSTATGSFTIKHLAFKVGEGEWADTSMVADDVTVRFKLVLSGMAPL